MRGQIGVVGAVLILGFKVAGPVVSTDSSIGTSTRERSRSQWTVDYCVFGDGRRRGLVATGLSETTSIPYEAFSAATSRCCCTRPPSAEP